MDAIELLKQDHRQVEQLFQQFQQGGGAAEFKQLFTQLYTALSLHALAEENVFYPASANFKELAPLLQDSFKDHAKMKADLGTLATLDNTSQEWSTKMTKLMQEVMSHVQEEEGQLFPKVQQHVDQQTLQQWGQDIQKAKQLSTQAVQDSVPMKEINGSFPMMNMGGMQGQQPYAQQ